MNNVLMVPIHLDALCLKENRTMVEGMADFSRLPYFDEQNKRDINPNIANISEEIVSQPFQNQNLHLKAGIHLHWSLPDALTRGIHVTEAGKIKTTFPAVPNRWLVTRSNKDNKPEKQWVVESDYLYPRGKGSQSGSIAYPMTSDEGQPFRYMGRKIPLETWQQEHNASNQPKYLESLTAVGYGEPAFSAFYPNCHSVFGFHDDDVIKDLSKTTYDVVGWYSKRQQEHLNNFVDELKSALPQYTQTTPIDLDFLKAEFKWDIHLDSDKQDSDKILFDKLRFLCYARIEFEPSNGGSEQTNPTSSISVSVGNTGTEALSAYLAQKIDKGNQSIIEDQLEALHLASSLEHRQLDMTPKFKEARHENGFTAVPAGLLWTIRPEGSNAAAADAQDAHDQMQVTLPDELADQLNELNLCQQQYDCGLHEIEAMRRQIFADWYKYMLSAYPPTGSRDEYPDIDQVKHFITVKGITALNKKLALSKSVAVRLATAIEQITKAIKALNLQDSTDEEKAKTTYQLKQVSSPRYWQLKEPVVLITGDEAQSSPRHGQDGRLRDDGLLGCQLIKNISFPLRRESFSAIRQAIDCLEVYDLNLMSLEDVDDLPSEGNCLMIVAKINGSYYVRIFDLTGSMILDKGNDEFSPGTALVQEIDLALSRESIDNQTKISLIRKITASLGEESIAFSCWTKQPWHPLLLEWEVEVFPLKEGSNHASYSKRYDPGFITKNYALKENEADLSLASGKGALAKGANIYHGRSVLTPHANVKLKAELAAYLKRQLRDDYYELKTSAEGKSKQEKAYLVRIQKWYKNDAPSLELSKKNDAELDLKNIDDIKSWYERKPVFDLDNPKLLFSQLSPEKKIKNPIYTVLLAAEACQSLNGLSQSLGGFNEALLMHKQTLQLPIADPLGFEDYRPFTEGRPSKDDRSSLEAVRDAVQQSIRSAPEPLNDFNPLRSGAMKIIRLRLIDTFGQVKDLDVSDIKTPERMIVPGSPHLVSLPPRLVQPTRLNFRWLSASQGEQEMNHHPATTPVCGWILPNNLDNSLAIYDNSGLALGSINQDAQWEPAPGYNRPVYRDEISNPYLRKVVDYLSVRINEKSADIINPKRSFLQNFITALDNGLENIDPESFAQHQGLALLMGRPIAVVRASLNLELQGLPAINQDWDVFWRDLRRKSRETDGFEKVKFPVRLGEHQQLNDGLVGYWFEEEDALGKMFYAPQSDLGQDYRNHIRLHSEANPWHFDLCLGDSPQVMTMLLDPRGKVHATCGIVPTKAIDIPPEQYKDALQNISITFLTAPVLTQTPTVGSQAPDIALPDEAGYEWSWLERRQDEWVEQSPMGSTSVNATFTGQQVLREGWLKLSKATDTNAT